MVSDFPGTGFRGSCGSWKGKLPRPCQPAAFLSRWRTGSCLGAICNHSVSPCPRPKLPGGVCFGEN